MVFPVLFGEDGTELFAYYLDQRGLGSILRSYGRIHLFRCELSRMAGRGPCRWQRSHGALAVAAVVVSVLSLSLFTSSRFEGLIPRMRDRCVVCVCMTLVPVGSFALMTCTMFVGWHLLLVALLLLFAAPPAAGLAALDGVRARLDLSLDESCVGCAHSSLWMAGMGGRFSRTTGGTTPPSVWSLPCTNFCSSVIKPRVERSPRPYSCRGSSCSNGCWPNHWSARWVGPNSFPTACLSRSPCLGSWRSYSPGLAGEAYDQQPESSSWGPAGLRSHSPCWPCTGASRIVEPWRNGATATSTC